MTVESFTGNINTNNSFEDIETLTGLTLTVGNDYCIQIQNIGWIKYGDAEFAIVKENPFTYTCGEDTLYIKTNELGAMLTILDCGEHETGGGGGGSYTLPTASASTKGGVKIDGTTITINDAVISATVDSALSSTSDYPVKNKVIYPSLSKFIPYNTTINIKADGTGDFATLAEALTYLQDKWSDGRVIIQLDAGTHTFMSSQDTYLIYSGRYKNNIPFLQIEGASKSTTTLDLNGKQLYLEFADIIFANLTITDTINANPNYVGLFIRYSSNIVFQTVKTNNFTVQVYKNSALGLEESCEMSNATAGVLCYSGSRIRVTNNISCTSVGYCFCINYGGTIILDGTNLTYSNVTKYFGLWGTDEHFSKTGFVNSLTGDGIIVGKITATQAS